ncbi:hypothetical protein [Tardiphaga sp. 862_B3_N1_1]|uniref:hypothetical protein n=1 Tax=Tardiphaga sp. 862_B3_N1_1 TaxID=3240763 RepID=UPI003F8A2A62
MQNPYKGEISFEASGFQYKLVYSNNAFCALEDHLGRGILDIYEEIGSWSPKRDAKGKVLPETEKDAADRAKRIRLSFCRSVFWAGLLDRNPDMTLSQAGDLMTAVGGLMPVMRLIMSGIVAAQPEDTESQGARPPKGAKRSGTGSAS